MCSLSSVCCWVALLPTGVTGYCMPETMPICFYYLITFNYLINTWLEYNPSRVNNINLAKCAVKCAIKWVIECAVTCAVKCSLKCDVKCAVTCAVKCAVTCAVKCVVKCTLKCVVKCAASSVVAAYLPPRILCTRLAHILTQITVYARRIGGQPYRPHARQGRLG